MSKTNIDKILTERGSRYGDFKDHAEMACALKDVFIKAGYLDKPAYVRQALDVIADKIARMLNGDCLYLDNWVDIQGYSKLVQQIINPVMVGGESLEPVIPVENYRPEPEPEQTILDKHNVIPSEDARTIWFKDGGFIVDVADEILNNMTFTGYAAQLTRVIYAEIDLIPSFQLEVRETNSLAPKLTLGYCLIMKEPLKYAFVQDIPNSQYFLYRKLT